MKFVGRTEEIKMLRGMRENSAEEAQFIVITWLLSLADM